MIIEIVDAKEKIDELMPHIDEMVQEGLVTLEPVQVIQYRANEKGPYANTPRASNKPRALSS